MVGKHYRVVTTNTLRREAIRLDDKKKLHHQFKETFKISCDGANDEQDNKEERTTCNKLSKTFCETLLFRVASELWKIRGRMGSIFVRDTRLSLSVQR